MSTEKIKSLTDYVVERVVKKFQPGPGKTTITNVEMGECLDLLTKVSVIHRNMNIAQEPEEYEDEDTYGMSDEDLAKALKKTT